MAELPVRKFVKVWIKRRKNRTSMSYTLEWVEFAQRRFLSLGPHATLAYTRACQRRKEAELNRFDRQAGLEPITWNAFTKKYLDTFYPGHDEPPRARKVHAAAWPKSFKTFKREKNAIDSFTRLLNPYWCHDLGDEDGERFVQKRLPEVGSGPHGGRGAPDAPLPLQRHAGVETPPPKAPTRSPVAARPPSVAAGSGRRNAPGRTGRSGTTASSRFRRS
jgi:hypothetical protein